MQLDDGNIPFTHTSLSLGVTIATTDRLFFQPGLNLRIDILRSSTCFAEIDTNKTLKQCHVPIAAMTFKRRYCNHCLRDMFMSLS